MDHAQSLVSLLVVASDYNKLPLVEMTSKRKATEFCKSFVITGAERFPEEFHNHRTTPTYRSMN
jgi:hypothetical protein